MEIGDVEKTDTDRPLRLRGGGDVDPGSQDDMVTCTSSNTMTKNSGGMAAGVGKRDTTSPGGAPAKRAPDAEHTRFNSILGWLEQTVALERTKKLTVQVSEGMLEKITELRNIMHTIIGENSRLKGRLIGRDENLKETLGTFVTKLGEKAEEIEKLKNENLELRKAILINEKQLVLQPAVAYKTETYAQVVLDKPKANKTKNNKQNNKARFEQCRETRSGTRFMIEVPADNNISNVKADLWQTIKKKLPSPRAKTVVSGKSLIIIPDDNNTLEMLQTIPNLKAIGPKQPRIIVYDVDAQLSEEDLADGLLLQNPELGLTQDEIKAMVVKHKLGPKDGSTTHWIIETPAQTLPKLEDKFAYLGMTRCKIKVYKNTTQCFRCQKYGHTALKCNQEKPTCRHCAEGHDSRECSQKEKAIYANCKQDHKSSSSACKARDRAIQNLLRRTDFGQK